MLVRPREMKDQLVAYVGSEYDTKRSNFMGVMIRNGKFVYVYNNGDGMIFLFFFFFLLYLFQFNRNIIENHLSIFH